MYETWRRGESKAAPKRCYKEHFKNKPAAERRAAKLLLLPKFRDCKVLRPYLCPNCGRWHLTSKIDVWATL